jgi:2-keto-4-pentenoate hydratase/2-oxohepta-3-ene-1,7-dioic acid hydratase in catechol pathway
MRLVTFADNGSTRLGVLNGDSITDLSRAAPELPTEMNAFLSAGEAAIAAARVASGDDIALKDVTLLSPVSQPGKILAVALNYRDHLEEVQEAMPDFPTPQTPMLFTKQNSSVTGLLRRFICRLNQSSLIMKPSWPSSSARPVAACPKAAPMRSLPVAWWPMMYPFAIGNWPRKP